MISDTDLRPFDQLHVHYMAIVQRRTSLHFSVDKQLYKYLYLRDSNNLFTAFNARQRMQHRRH